MGLLLDNNKKTGQTQADFNNKKGVSPLLN